MSKSPERSNRPGDSQPLPTPNNRSAIQDLVAVDLAARKELGIRRYGTPLQAFNGRSALRDAYEEALDLCCYLRQQIEEDETGGRVDCGEHGCGVPSEQ